MSLPSFVFRVIDNSNKGTYFGKATSTDRCRSTRMNC
jgi:hypothetical protein